MAKVSMAQAAKMFAVSRPTLAKHLSQGKISGEKVGEAWELDTAELARVYAYRDVKPAPEQHAGLSAPAGGSSPDLQAEIRVLQARLEAAQALAEERGRHIEDLRKMLTGPENRPSRRRWWPF